jgi:hypothetical protein
MFVRFRERPNDAREPYWAQATRLCTGRCANRRGQQQFGMRWGVGCPERPRCRWRVAGLVPYRLLVSLSETRRVATASGGKVRHEHVADLGAIDGTMLPAFYAGLDAEAAQAACNAAWHRRSIVTRLSYWNGLEARLARLVNRLDEAQAAMVRQAVHARIAQPTEQEIAETEARKWLKLFESYHRLVTDEQASIEKLEDIIRGRREWIAQMQPLLDDIAGGERTAERYREYSLDMGRILAARRRSW